MIGWMMLRLAVFLADPLVLAVLDLVLGRADELGLRAHHRLEHRARVVDGQADADRHQERQVLQPRDPLVRVQLALADDVEVGHRGGRREEQRHVDEQHLVPAHVVADHHRRKHQHRQRHHQHVVEVRAEVEERLGLHARAAGCDARIRGSSLRHVWMEPLAQRCCCDLKAFISTGSSAGTTTSGTKWNFQPRSWVR